MKIGMNGTGLTARSLLKLAISMDEFKDIDIVQINGRTMTIDLLKDRLLYSSSQGHSNLKIEIQDDYIIVNGKKIKFTAISEPEKIEWLPEIELLIEATGKFRDISKPDSDPNRHFQSPNNKLKGIVLSAPGKGGVKDYMWGASPNLKEELLEIVNKGEQFVIGAASCTTTATIPIVDTLDEAFGIESCFLTTIHAVTRSQDILDGSKGWSALDTQLHTTGATSSTNKVLQKDIPLDGIAYRTSDKSGSFIQIDSVLKRNVTIDEILDVFKTSKYKDYISYSEVAKPPSSYVRGNSSMVMLIPDQITVVNNNRVIVRGLYDNEEGYAAHMLRLIKYLVNIIK